MLTIGEFSKISRVSAKTLRYYDQIGLFKPEAISSDTGYRYYGVSQLRDMLLITKLKQYQFSLPEIAAVLAKRDNAFLRNAIRAKKEAFLQQIQDQNHILFQMEQDILKIERNENIMQANYMIKTIQTQPKNICSVRKRMGVADFGPAFGELFAILGRSGLSPMGPSFAIYHEEESFNPENTDIEVGVEVNASGGDHVRTLDNGLCCYATHIGSYDSVGACYAALMEWIESEGYKVNGPPLELYIKGFESKVDPSEFVTEVYFPIGK